MTEREELYAAFMKADLETNRGMIIKQLAEIEMLMKDPSGRIVSENRLNDILEYAVCKSEYYRKYASYKDLSDFPVIKKTDIRDKMDDFISNDFKGDETLTKRTTSGSTGTPFTVLWDHRKHCRFIGDIKYYQKLAGIESHERILFIHADRKKKTIDKDKESRDNLYNIYYSLLDDENLGEIVRKMQDVNPTMLIAYGSMWDAIANYIYEGKFDKGELDIRSIISEAEALKSRTKDILEDFFGCRVYSRYGNMECGVMAQEDEKGKGHLLNTASYKFEMLGLDSNQPVPDGQVGRIIVTDLYNFAMPLIRYDTGDLGIRRTDEEGFEYLEQLVGRKNDVLYTTDGRLVNQHHIVIFSSKFKDVKRFQFIQESEKEYTCLLVSDNHTYEQEMLQEFKDVFGRDGTYHIKYVQEIPALPSGKYQITVCKVGH